MRRGKIMRNKIFAFALFLIAAAGVLSSCSLLRRDTETMEKYIIVTDFQSAPFNFLDGDGRLKGIDADVIEAIAKNQGFKYELRAVGFDAALDAMRSGYADGMIAALPITEDYAAEFDFSEAYYNSYLTVATAEGCDVWSYDDFLWQNVAVRTGTGGKEAAYNIAAEIPLTVTEYEGKYEMYKAVEDGNAIACFEEYPVMAYYINQGTPLVIRSDMTLPSVSYGFAVAKGQRAELLNMFNAGLMNIIAEGKLQEIVDRYI